MIGLGIGPEFQAFRRSAGPVLYSFEAGQFPTALSFSRAGGGTRHDASGAINDVAADQPRFDFGPAGGNSTALLYEPAATNHALYASDPANSDGWIAAASHNGLAIDRVATGLIGDLAYADYRVQGTATSSFTDKFYLSAPSRTPAAQGQTFSASCFVQVIGGSADNVGKFTVSVIEEDAAQAFLSQTISGWTIDFPVLTRIEATRTMADPGTGFVRLAMVLSSLTVGGVIDITLRVAGPQLEEGAAPSSFIQVPGAAAVTRGEDRLFLPAYGSERTLTVTFADATTEVLAASSLVAGELPRFANRAIARIDAVPA